MARFIGVKTKDATRYLMSHLSLGGSASSPCGSQPVGLQTDRTSLCLISSSGHLPPGPVVPRLGLADTSRSMWQLQRTHKCLGPLFSFDYIVFGLGKRKLSSKYPISFLNLHRFRMCSLHKQPLSQLFPG